LYSSKIQQRSSTMALSDRRDLAPALAELLA
jgi:hypothetical protein